jgi:hypothetical protein
MSEVRVWAMFALAAVLVAGALLLSGCGGGGSGETTVNGDSPKELLEVANLRGIYSGDFQGTFKLIHLGKVETIYIRVSGEFAKSGDEALPQFRVSTSSKNVRNGRTSEFNGRLFFLPQETVFVYGPTFGEQPYKPDASIVEEATTKVEAAQKEGGKGDLSACSEAAEGLELESLMHNFEFEGHRQESDGTAVFVVGGNLDVPGLIATLRKFGENPGCAAQLRAVGLPLAQELEAADAGKLEATNVAIGVDGHGLLRSLSLLANFKDPAGESTQLTLTGSLWNVNRKVQVIGSATGRTLAALLRRFGINLEEALQAEGDEIVLGLLEGFGGALTGRMPQVAFPART